MTAKYPSKLIGFLKCELQNICLGIIWDMLKMQISGSHPRTIKSIYRGGRGRLGLLILISFSSNSWSHKNLKTTEIGITIVIYHLTLDA